METKSIPNKVQPPLPFTKIQKEAANLLSSSPLPSASSTIKLSDTSNTHMLKNAVQAVSLDNQIHYLIQPQQQKQEENLIFPRNRLINSFYSKNGFNEGADSALTSVTQQQLGNENNNRTFFDPLHKIKLPNGSWTPSCKNVS